MSTAIVPGSPGTIDVSGTTAVPFSRLVKVEWRKMLDTRSGRWLLLATLALLVLTVLIVLLVSANQNDAPNATIWVTILTVPLSLLIPVFPILSVTSEWSQRTGLGTFTLEANRGRLLASKLVAVLLMALGTIAVAVLLGAIANPIAASLAGGEADWTLDGRSFAITIALQVLYFLMAFGIGTVLLSSPAAIAVFYVAALLLPMMVYGILYGTFDWAQGLIPWVDMQYAATPFLDGGHSLEGVDWARMVTSVLLWVVAPLTLGWTRVRTTEIK